MAEIDGDGVRVILDRSSISPELQNRLYHAEIATNGWYFLTDDLGLVYLLCCKNNFPSRCANACLRELEQGFKARVTAEKAATGKSAIFNLVCEGLFQRLSRKYDNVLEVDSVGNIPVGRIEIEHLDIDDSDPFIQNCAKLFTIDRSSEDLLKVAGTFKNNEQYLRKKSWISSVFGR